MSEFAGLPIHASLIPTHVHAEPLCYKSDKLVRNLRRPLYPAVVPEGLTAGELTTHKTTYCLLINHPCISTLINAHAHAYVTVITGWLAQQVTLHLALWAEQSARRQTGWGPSANHTQKHQSSHVHHEAFFAFGIAPQQL